tara:strand:+ start:38052 stop:38681 length:630 start_codon:yes stop_codon:yes gene_type:complete
MSPLPHFTQVQSHGSTHPNTSEIYEPVYPSLFEITFVLPAIVQNQGRDPLLLLENATSIDGIAVHKDLGSAMQRFKYSTRMFLTMPQDTSLDGVTINFNVNVGNAGDVFNYNALRAWYDLGWNSQNGTLSYKRDIVGTVIINHHDRKGYIIRRITLHNCQMKKMNGYLEGVKWDQNQEIVQDVGCEFIVDYWTDERVDLDTGSPGNVYE